MLGDQLEAFVCSRTILLELSILLKVKISGGGMTEMLGQN